MVVQYQIPIKPVYPCFQNPSAPSETHDAASMEGFSSLGEMFIPANLSLLFLMSFYYTL